MDINVVTSRAIAMHEVTCKGAQVSDCLLAPGGYQVVKYLLMTERYLCINCPVTHNW